MNHLDEYLPPAATWFSNTVSYEGNGRINFSSPRGWIDGRFTCEIDELGKITSFLSIQDWRNEEEPTDPSSDGSLDLILSGGKYKRSNSHVLIHHPSIPTDNTIVSISLRTSDGGNLIPDLITRYTWHPPEGIKLDFDKVTYIANNQSKSNSKYWVIPCVNFVPNPSFPVAHWEETLTQHPLRIYPMPTKALDFLASDASAEDKSSVSYGLGARSYIIAFTYDNEPAFIERLPDYDEAIADLVDCPARSRVTSLMVGVGVYSSDEHEMRPVDLLGVLGLATGRPVGASWIEFRDKDANLVYRIHALLKSADSFGRGQAVVTDYLHNRGFEQLLTTAAASGELDDSLIRGALRHAAYAMSGKDSTMMFYYTFTALNELFTHYKIEIDLPKLAPSQIEDIRKILKRTMHEILNLRKNVTPDEAVEIEKVANKFNSVPLGKRSGFGEQMAELMRKVGLHDLEVIATYYSSINSSVNEWIQRVDDDFRNRTMHTTHLKNIFDPQMRKDINRILFHVIDILIRILLKTLQYNGDYAPYMQPHLSEKVDWVERTTSPSSLGYK